MANDNLDPPGIGADTGLRVNVKHLLMALGALAGMGWGLTKYFYEQTHENIDKVHDEVKDLEKKFDELDKRIDNHDVKISAWESRKDAAKRLAMRTGMDDAEAQATVGFREFGGLGGRGGGGTRPFVKGATGQTTRSADTGSGSDSSDRDNDGVPNGFDMCPEDRETWNSFQDDDGCPDEVPMMLSNESHFRDGFVAACADRTFLRRFHTECVVCIQAKTDAECQAAMRHMMESDPIEDSYAYSMDAQHYEDGEDDGGAYYPNESAMVMELAPPSRWTLRKWERQKKRQEKRVERKRRRQCKQDPESCLVIQRDWPLDAASHVLSELQNAEADLRD